MKPISADFEQPQPNKKVLKPLDTDRAPEYDLCRACGKRHSKLGEHIACLNNAVDEIPKLIAKIGVLEIELRAWRYAKEEIQSIKQLPRSTGGLVESRDIKDRRR